MLHNIEKDITTYDIIITPFMSNIPENAKENERETLEQFLVIINLISEKFKKLGVKHLEGRYNQSNPQEVSIAFSNKNRYGSTHEIDANIDPVFLLECLGGTTKKSASETVVTTRPSRFNEIIRALELRDAPDNRFRIKC